MTGESKNTEPKSNKKLLKNGHGWDGKDENKPSSASEDFGARFDIFLLYPKKPTYRIK
jgi:hypothetical protein